jgi:hypothetical protein
MAGPERDIINTRLLNLAGNERLFRINAGMGWAGTVVKRTPRMIILENPRPFHGAPVGWPDLTGWTEVIITPDMVGQSVAVFTAEEVKAGTQRIKKGSRQDDFREIIGRMGGIHRVINKV